MLGEKNDDKNTSARKDGNNIDPHRGNLILTEPAARQTIPLIITSPAAIWTSTIDTGAVTAKRYTE
jgi:hypothetical protein